MEQEKNSTETERGKLPHELQGYGIEEGVPDFDLLDKHGKMPRYFKWQEENQVATAGAQKMEEISAGVREAAEEKIGDGTEK